MRGLLIKDIELLLVQKRTLFIFVFICAIMSISSDTSFVIGYLTFIGAMMANSTISYDEADNGMIFLSSMPHTRKDYVREKYLFAYGLVVACYVISIMLFEISTLIRHVDMTLLELLNNTMMIWGIAFIVIAFMLPPVLKYGMEKGRIIWMLIMVVIMVGAITIGKKVAKGDFAGSELLQRITDLGVTKVTIIIFVIAAVMGMISILISENIMKKKEF